MQQAIRVVLSGVLLLAVAGHLRAGLVQSPTAVIANSLGQFNNNFRVENLINQRGLLSGFDSGVTDFDTYIAGNPGHADPSSQLGGGFSSPFGVSSGTIDFDLGAEHTLDRLALWNNNATNTSVRDFSLSISSDASFSEATSLGQFSAGLTQFAQVFDLANASGRFVRLNIANTHGSGIAVNFGEVAFDVVQPAAIPEPASWLLGSAGLLVLLGADGWRSRRRRTV